VIKNVPLNSTRDLSQRCPVVSIRRGTNSFTLSPAATAGLVTALLIVAFAPLVAYRFVPAGAAVWLDQFSLARKIGVGAFVSNSPSQLGAMVTWAFLCVALLVWLARHADQVESSSTSEETA